MTSTPSSPQAAASADLPPFAADRYERMSYRRCGRSGLKLPALSLGGWHNFQDHDTARRLMRRAFDLGITHFDFANNYGPPPGSAETNAGDILKKDFAAHRDELIVSTKAGFYMWPGPYGEWGSRKNLLASLDQSLKRLQLDYVDIFYHHRPDPDTPLEETMGALEQAVRQGKALYVGISNYRGGPTVAACHTLRQMNVPLLIHQANYSMLNRWIEPELLPQTHELGVGVIAFCPLAQGLLTDKYLGGIPADSRAASASQFLKEDRITPELVQKLHQLNDVARQRGQSLAQLALTWVLRDPRVTSALIGASRIEQIEQNVEIVDAPPLSDDELERIEAILGQ